MVRLKGVRWSKSAFLAGDAALLTAALVGAGTAGTVALILPNEDAGQQIGWPLQVLPLLLLYGPVVACPLIAWFLHKRHLTWSAAIGGVAGGVLAWVVLAIVSLVAAGVGGAASTVTGSDLAAPIVTLVVSGLGLLALATWLAGDAVADLSHDCRAHLRLDVVRLAAVLVAVLVVVGTLVRDALNPGDDVSVGVIHYMVMWGVVGGMIALGAEAGAVFQAGRTGSTTGLSDANNPA